MRENEYLNHNRNTAAIYQSGCCVKEIAKNVQGVLMHTGQHYDYNMPEVFLRN